VATFLDHSVYFSEYCQVQSTFSEVFGHGRKGIFLSADDKVVLMSFTWLVHGRWKRSWRSLWRRR